MRDFIKNILCNGVSHVDPMYRKYDELFEPMIDRIRQRILSSNFETLPDANFGYHAGTRFLDNEAVLLRIYTALQNNSINEEYFQEDEVEYLVAEGLRECADADWYYTFEKNYD